MKTTKPNIEIIHWVMALVRIRSFPLVLESPSYFDLLLIHIIFKHRSFQVYCTLNYLNHLIIIALGSQVRLVIEFKLKAVRTVKLNPISVLLRVVLPSPVQILRRLYYLNHLLRYFNFTDWFFQLCFI